ncbi:MAG: hypothetical protein IE931_14025 [Sphingobacteriales bacterium]|nr:hypothetical protein [Sphingobacteriales bacterium]
MNYDIKILNNYEGKGRIELNRMAFLLSHVKSIAQKALLLQLYGYSMVSLPTKFQKYLNIFLMPTQHDGDNTLLTLDADNFSNLPVQLDAFRDKTDLNTLTPMALVIKTFTAALNDNEDKNLLDEPIIDELIKFKKFFNNDTESILLSNRQSIPEIQFSVKEIDKIEALYKTIPIPQKTVINGTIDEMKFSRKQLILITTDKQRVVILPQSDDLLIEVKDFFGKEITLTGMAHFKPGGQLSYVKLESFTEPGISDKFFSHKPNKMSVQQQIALQIRDGKKRNPLDDIIGKWPGNETDEEFEQMLKSLN